MDNDSPIEVEAPLENPATNVKEFLEKFPPSKEEWVAEMATQSRAGWFLNTPEIQLHCDKCNGDRLFACGIQPALSWNAITKVYLEYVCKNCGEQTKTFAIAALIARRNGVIADGNLYKFGEQPLFGPPTPTKLTTLIGAERDYFIKGRRCEFQGLGIAAFAYYRRVVETQKSRILEQIRKVAVQIGADEELLKELELAQKETQFSKALDYIKHGIPELLLIRGNNPLTLLHTALSEGIHATTDDECLQIATSIRIVLTELVERMGAALKDETELNSAVARLIQAKKK